MNLLARLKRYLSPVQRERYREAITALDRTETMWRAIAALTLQEKRILEEKDFFEFKKVPKDKRPFCNSYLCDFAAKSEKNICLIDEWNLHKDDCCTGCTFDTFMEGNGVKVCNHKYYYNYCFYKNYYRLWLIETDYVISAHWAEEIADLAKENKKRIKKRGCLLCLKPK